jgi:hypothetical protein
MDGATTKDQAKEGIDETQQGGMYEIGFNSSILFTRWRPLVLWPGRCAGADTDADSDTDTNSRSGCYRNLRGVGQHLRRLRHNVRPDLGQSVGHENRNDGNMRGNDDCPPDDDDEMQR